MGGLLACSVAIDWMGNIVPTITRIGGYRFFFYANEAGEPRHIHVQRESKLAKFWLQPVALAGSVGFAGHELRELLGLAAGQRETFVEA